MSKIPQNATGTAYIPPFWFGTQIDIFSIFSLHVTRFVGLIWPIPKLFSDEHPMKSEA